MALSGSYFQKCVPLASQQHINFKEQKVKAGKAMVMIIEWTRVVAVKRVEDTFESYAEGRICWQNRDGGREERRK